jgi:hypothetical protein
MMQLKIKLLCGTEIEMEQKEGVNMVEMLLTPPDTANIDLTAWIIKDNKLRINARPESLMGLYEALGLIIYQPKSIWNNRLAIGFAILAVAFMGLSAYSILFHWR